MITAEESELIKVAVGEAENDGYKTFPEFFTCVYSYRGPRFKVKGHHVGTPLLNTNKAVYVVRDKKQKCRYDVIHNLPRLVSGQIDNEWEITQVEGGVRNSINRFLDWKNREPHKSTKLHKLGRVLFAMLLGATIGHSIINALFNVWYLVIAIPCIIYLGYSMMSSFLTFNKYKKNFKEKHGMNPNEWFKKTMEE